MRLPAILLSFALALGLPAAAAADGITVTFRLIGADAGGEFTTWIATKTYAVPADSTVSDVFDLALADANLTPAVTHSDWGGYLSAIDAPSVLGGFTLGEDTTGEGADAVYAGWMFSVNNLLSDAAMTETRLSEGDSVVFFYAYDMGGGIDWATGDASGAPAMAAPDTAPPPRRIPGAGNPKTGDGGNLTVWLCLGGAGLLGLGAVTAIGKRGKRHSV